MILYLLRTLERNLHRPNTGAFRNRPHTEFAAVPEGQAQKLIAKGFRSVDRDQYVQAVNSHVGFETSLKTATDEYKRTAPKRS